MEGMTEGDAKFRKVEELSDSEEEDMQMVSDMSDDDSASNQDAVEQHASKKRRVEQDPPAPKWSNPDPYTALPPPDESLAKRKDVVKMIRKAKASGGPAQSNSGISQDFISFNLDEEPGEKADDAQNSDSDDSSVVEVIREIRAPAGSRFSHLDNLHPDRDSSRRSAKDDADATEGIRLFVGNLNFHATEADLEKLFSQFSLSVKIMLLANVFHSANQAQNFRLHSGQSANGPFSRIRICDSGEAGRRRGRYFRAPECVALGSSGQD